METNNLSFEKIEYDNSIVRSFLFATIFWGVLAFVFGLMVAVLLFWPELPEVLFGTDDFGVQSLGLKIAMEFSDISTQNITTSL